MPHLLDMGLIRQFLIYSSVVLVLIVSGPDLWADGPGPLATPALSSRAREPLGTEAYPDSVFHDMAENKEIRKHVVADIELNAANEAVPVQIHPRTITITILGPSADGQLRKRITAYVDNTQLSAGVYVRPAKIRLPEGYVLVDARPEIFVLEINPEKKSNP